jgi:hypothetical protein
MGCNVFRDVEGVQAVDADQENMPKQFVGLVTLWPVGRLNENGGWPQKGQDQDEPAFFHWSAPVGANLSQVSD